MSKCAKVKNPCKVCLQSVNNKNGLQCKGACKKWAHYTCLNYTPGKIQDIKAGIITVTCPCPNCAISGTAKEFLTVPPFTCNNQQCPANLKPKCQIGECPVNKPSPALVPILNPSPPGISRGVSPKSLIPICTDSRTDTYNQPQGMPESCPMLPCEKLQDKSPFTKKETPPGARSPNKIGTPMRLPSRNMNPSQIDLCSNKSAADIPFTPTKSASCSYLCSGECAGNKVDTFAEETKTTITLKSGDCKLTNSDSRLMSPHAKPNDKALLCTIHELCSTIGHLSQQIKDLMCKMITNLDTPPARTTST